MLKASHMALDEIRKNKVKTKLNHQYLYLHTFIQFINIIHYILTNIY